DKGGDGAAKRLLYKIVHQSLHQVVLRAAGGVTMDTAGLIPDQIPFVTQPLDHGDDRGARPLMGRRKVFGDLPRRDRMMTGDILEVLPLRRTEKSFLVHRSPFSMFLACKPLCRRCVDSWSFSVGVCRHSI